MKSNSTHRRPFVSVIIPVGTETEIGFYKQIYENLASEDRSMEVVWVSSNQHLNEWIVGKKGARLISLKSKQASRGFKMQLGVEKSTGLVCVFHHPRSLMGAGWLKELSKNYESSANPASYWGGFTHSFLPPGSKMLRFTSWYSNFVRGDLKQILYLDHCIFSSRKLLMASGGVPNEPVFEDTLLSKKLRKKGKYRRLLTRVMTSSIRFQKNGFFLQASINLVSKAMFYVGLPPRLILKVYEFRNWLN